MHHRPRRGGVGGGGDPVRILSRRRLRPMTDDSLIRPAGGNDLAGSVSETADALPGNRTGRAPTDQAPTGPQPGRWVLSHGEIRTIVLGLMLAMFLAALNQTIVATALATIVLGERNTHMSPLTSTRTETGFEINGNAGRNGLTVPEGEMRHIASRLDMAMTSCEFTSPARTSVYATSVLPAGSVTFRPTNCDPASGNE